MNIIRTDSTNADFIFLVKELDDFLAILDGEEHAFYNQLNKIDTLKHALVAYDNGMPVACGAIREFSPGIMEVKRMYTVPGYRGRGIATKLLCELEKWAIELSCNKCVLETGWSQPDAIHMYIKHGYRRIPNYGKYAGVSNSVCFEKAFG